MCIITQEKFPFGLTIYIQHDFDNLEIKSLKWILEMRGRAREEKPLLPAVNGEKARGLLRTEGIMNSILASPREAYIIIQHEIEIQQTMK